MRGEGLRVKIEPIAGITEPGVMPGNGFYFQCPPLEEFTFEAAHAHTEYDTVREGQMSRRGGRQLMTVSFDTLVVDYGWYTVLNETVLAEEVRDQLLDILHSGTAFLLTAAHQMPAGGFRNWSATEAGAELQIPATLRSVRVTEKAGEGDARYFALAFSEYRDPLVSRRKYGSSERGRDLLLPVTGYLLKPSGYFRYRGRGQTEATTIKGKLATMGDPVPEAVTLVDLAKHFYGDPSLARFIARVNAIVWGTHAELIRYQPFAQQSKPKIRIPGKPVPGEPVVIEAGPQATTSGPLL